MMTRDPAARHHPVLGALKYDARDWRCAPPGTSVPVYLTAGREGPDAQLLDAAVDAVHQLDALNERARAFGEAAWTPAPRLTLLAVEVGRPVVDWVRHEVLPRDRAAAEQLLNGAVAVTLQYAIEGDRNVLDVVCVRGLPVAWDYH